MIRDVIRDMIRETAQGCTLAIRVQPGAKKTAIVGIYGEGSNAALKIAVHAPPIDGRANEALVAFLAMTFAIPKSAIDLLAGASSRSKIVLLRGVSMAAAAAVLNESAK